MRMIDETGNVYNRLTVLEKYKEKGKRLKWKCQCVCGAITYVDGRDLRNGHTQSCGCLNKERVSQASLNDLTNQQFGFLTVLSRDMNYQGKGVPTHWFCKCNKCGTIKSMPTESLRKGAISCGCVKSKGEYKIAKLLNLYDVPFQKEFYFSDEEKKRYYDFAIFNHNNQLVRLIEFDGSQHYQKSRNNFFSTMTLEEQKKRDSEKNKIAKAHNIQLIRIPYWKLDTLTIYQLLDDTFIVKEE